MVDQKDNELNRAAEARRILDSELFSEAVQALRTQIMTAWTESPLRDAEGQAQLRLMIHCLDAVVQYLSAVVETGKLATIELEREKAKRRTRIN